MKFETYFETNEELLFKFHGTSMQPMLDAERDVVIIRRKGPERLKLDDVAMFRRNGNYVLHRVVAVYPDGYDFLGDNCLHGENAIPEQDVLGVMTAFEHLGVTKTADDPEYLAYVKHITKTRKARLFFKRMRSRAALLKRRLLRVFKH